MWNLNDNIKIKPDRRNHDNANSSASESDIVQLVREGVGTYHTSTAKTRRLFQYKYAHDSESNSHRDLSREIRLASRITEVHTCRE
jgi:hypothetical protein